MKNSKHKLLQPKADLFVQSYNIYKKYFFKIAPVYLGFILIIQLTTIVFENMLLNTDFNTQSLTTILIPYILLVTIVTNISQLFVAQFLNQENKKLNSGSTTIALSTISKKMIRIIAVTTIVSAITILLTFVFVIPGIYINTTLMFAVFFAVLDNASTTKSISSSFKLVKGNWWRVFGMLFLIGLLLGLISLGINSMIMIPNLFLSSVIGSSLLYVVSDTINVILVGIIGLICPIYITLLFLKLKEEKREET